MRHYRTLEDVLKCLKVNQNRSIDEATGEEIIGGCFAEMDGTAYSIRILHWSGRLMLARCFTDRKTDTSTVRLSEKRIIAAIYKSEEELEEAVEHWNATASGGSRLINLTRV